MPAMMWTDREIARSLAEQRASRRRKRKGRSAARKPPAGTTIVREGWFYLGTYLKDDKHEPKTGICTLIVRHAQLRRTARGNLRVHLTTDALEFPDETAMLSWIEENAAEELPAEADGQPRYVPEAFRVEGAVLA